jgi:RNA polymerase sigma factor (sigma-70 family)
VGEVGALVLRARRGDRAAWDVLVARYWRLVLAVAAQEGVREADREDVAQVTWLKLAQNLDRLENPDGVGAWLRTTCERESRRVRARAARQVPTEGELFDRIPDPVDVEEHVVRMIPDRTLKSALALLSERCQFLLRLLVFDVPYEEIGETMQMPIGSIGPTRQRCLDKLRELMLSARIKTRSTDS